MIRQPHPTPYRDLHTNTTTDGLPSIDMSLVKNYYSAVHITSLPQEPKPIASSRAFSDYTHTLNAVDSITPSRRIYSSGARKQPLRVRPISCDKWRCQRGRSHHSFGCIRRLASRGSWWKLDRYPWQTCGRLSEAGGPARYKSAGRQEKVVIMGKQGRG